MHLNVKFAVINEVESGVGRATGLPWRNQSVVITWEEPATKPESHPRVQRLVAKLYGEQIDRLKVINPVLHETVVPVDLCFDTDPYHNKVYNTVTLWLAE